MIPLLLLKKNLYKLDCSDATGARSITRRLFLLAKATLNFPKDAFEYNRIERMKDPRLDYMPMAARDYSAQRQMTVGDLLLDNRIIFLDGSIHDGSANLVIMKLLFLQSENRHQDIHLYINSPGGSVTATLAIYDIMQFIECDVATYCVGLSASGGAILVAGGAEGKRFALKHSKVMIHQPYGQVGGQVSDIEIQARDIIASRQLLNEILSLHTKQPVEKIAKDTQRDHYLTAQQAKDYGLVDEILDRKPSDKKK